MVDQAQAIQQEESTAVATLADINSQVTAINSQITILSANTVDTQAVTLETKAASLQGIVAGLQTQIDTYNYNCNNAPSVTITPAGPTQPYPICTLPKASLTNYFNSIYSLGKTKFFTTYPNPTSFSFSPINIFSPDYSNYYGDAYSGDLNVIVSNAGNSISGGSVNRWLFPYKFASDFSCSPNSVTSYDGVIKAINANHATVILDNGSTHQLNFGSGSKIERLSSYSLGSLVNKRCTYSGQLLPGNYCNVNYCSIY